MKSKILMVDDNKELLGLFKEILEPVGIKVITFSKVEEAKDYLKNPVSASQVRAIISDLMMGPTDGLDFLSYVKSEPSLQAIDFYLLTGAEVSVFEPFVRSHNVKGIINKPFKPKQLIDILTNDETTYFKNAA